MWPVYIASISFAVAVAALGILAATLVGIHRANQESTAKNSAIIVNTAAVLWQKTEECVRGRVKVTQQYLNGEHVANQASVEEAPPPTLYQSSMVDDRHELNREARRIVNEFNLAPKRDSGVGQEEV